ncbi:MAG: SCP2 sterol-binding domain-containing protein, partial [Pedobacter sp.]|nr:SCP2 sterol-binding domain-containing protein [Pedobacter sp.]
VMASNKLGVLSGMDKKLVEEARAKRLSAGAAEKPTVATVNTRDAAAPAIFAALEKRLASNKAAAEGLSQVFQFNVREPDAGWTVDFSVSPARVTAGKSERAAVTLGISDDNLKALVQGKRDLRDLYQHGDLRVDGDALLARKLGFLAALA